MSKSKKCNFCGRLKNQVAILIPGIDGDICNDCVDQASIILEKINPKAEKKQNSEFKIDLITPKEIKSFLDDYVIGQDKAKKVISVAVYNHFKRLQQSKKTEVDIEKSNIILTGETGTGKTLLAKTLAKILKVPFCIADATVLTEAGYVGEDVESIISRLLQAADFNVSAAERGIIYIDEIDKIARKGDNPSISRDVSGEGVQQGLLKILEGSICHVAPQGGRKHPDQKMIAVDTTNILFICGGAFEGIQSIIEKRLNQQSIGFKSNSDLSNQKVENILEFVSPTDLKTFGLIPEIIGRLPVLSHLNPLDKDTLKSILTKPKNALLKQYQALFELENKTLEIPDDVVDLIVDTAFKYKLGARGLRSICETILLDIMFENNKNEKNIIISKDLALEKLKNIHLLAA